MAAFTSLTPLERLADERDALVSWLAGEFADALSIEDAEDLVADALPTLAADPRLPAGGRRRRTYLRRALRRDAIDEIRHRHGRGLREGPRAIVPLEDAGELVDPAVPPEHHLEETQTQELRRAAVERTMDRLSGEDAELLRLRYLEQRAPSEIAAELGLSRTQYERRLSEAGAHGLVALIRAESGPACGPVRQLLRTGRIKTREDIARVDVHLLDCLHCRAFAARARGLLELAGLPIVAACERVMTKVGTLFGRGGDAAMREAHDTALAGGAAVGAGTAVTVGLGTKVAIGCTGMVIAAVCTAPIVHELTTKSKRPASVASAPTKPKRSTSKLRAKPTPTSTPLVVASSPTATPTASPAAKKKSPSRRLTQSERKRRNRVAAAREFGADAAIPDVNRTSSGTQASVSSTGGNASIPPPPPAPKPAARPKPPRSSSFSGEFRP